MDSLSLLELNSLVRRSLEQCLPDEYWIQTELSDVRSNTTGRQGVFTMVFRLTGIRRQ